MAQAPAMADRSHGWSGASTVSSVAPRSWSKATVVANCCFLVSASRKKTRMRELLRQIDLEPVSGIMPRDIGITRLRRPIRELLFELGLRDGDALRAVHFREAAGQ